MLYMQGKCTIHAKNNKGLHHRYCNTMMVYKEERSTNFVSIMKIYNYDKFGELNILVVF